MHKNIVSLTNPVLQKFLTYCSILVLKTLLMVVLTARQRFKHKAFATQEDAVYLKGKCDRSNEDVERVRRAHLNDLENIPLFFAIGFIYILTNPPAFLATTLFRVFTLMRILHTIVYAVVVLPQPARGIVWVIGYGITVYMALHSICYFCSF